MTALALSSTAMTIQTWWRQRLEQRNAVRLLALLHLMASDHVNAIHARTSSAAHGGGKHDGGGVAVPRLCRLVVCWEEDLHSANYERQLLLDELTATSAVVRGASDSARRLLSRSHPQLRRLAWLPEAASAALLREWELEAEEVEDGEGPTAATAAGTGSPLRVLSATIGADGCEWLLHQYVRGAKARSALAADASSYTLLRAVAALGRAAGSGGSSNNSSPAPHRRRTAAESIFLTNIDDVPPLSSASNGPTPPSEAINPPPPNGAAAAASVVSGTGDNCVVKGEDKARPPTPMKDREGKAAESEARPEEEGDNDDEEYSDNAYFHMRKQQSDVLAARLRRLLDMPPEATPVAGGGGHDNNDVGPHTPPAHVRPGTSGDTGLPSRDALRDVRVPYLGPTNSTDGSRTAAGYSDKKQQPQPLSSVCAVCELDGRPFSSEVAEVDEATTRNDGLLWPCNGCGRLLHWGCGLGAALLTSQGSDDGGSSGDSVVVFCSSQCRNEKSAHS